MDSSVIKAEALRKEKEANALCCSDSISDKKRGVELFLQVQKMDWGEVLVPGGSIEWSRSISCSDEFLGACLSLAIEAFENRQYAEAMKYCEYVRNSYEISGESSQGIGTLGTGLIHHSLKMQLKKRPGAFNPERGCAEVEIALCIAEDSPFYNLQEALYKKRRAAALGSEEAAKMLANHYYEAATSSEEVKEAVFFFELINSESDQEFNTKKKAAKDKYTGIMASKVTRVFMDSATWLPEPMEAGMTWERYSGLTEEVSRKLRRKPLDDRMLILDDKQAESERINGAGGYQPRVIDLNALWQQFVSHPKNQVVDKRILCFKKKKYNECLYLGDFTDCCKYLWEQTYKK